MEPSNRVGFPLFVDQSELSAAHVSSDTPSRVDTKHTLKSVVSTLLIDGDRKSIIRPPFIGRSQGQLLHGSGAHQVTQEPLETKIVRLLSQE